MSTATQLTEFYAEAQRQSLAALEQAHDWSIRATELAVGLIPRQPVFATPAAIVEASFGFASHLLESQKAFALRLAEIVTPASARPAKS